MYSLEAWTILIFSGLFSAASVVTIRGNPLVSMVMSTTSILLVGALYMAVGPAWSTSSTFSADAEDDCPYYQGTLKLTAVEPLPAPQGVECIYE